jgi:ATP-dependent helicase/nuclease subunit A
MTATTLDLPLDPGVRQREASDPAVSVWVGASAGTGKTKVLTDRVLRLMLAGTPPRRILCITFTKAAAAEMANRINDTLASWAAWPEGRLGQALFDLAGERPAAATMAKARRLFAEVVDCPGGMQILTLHAFAQSLLRRFPLEAGLSPNFEVMDERSAGEAMHEARRRVLVEARAEPAGALGTTVTRIAAAVNEEDFAGLMADIARERGRLGAILDAAGGLDPAVAGLFHALGVAPGETIADVIAAACREDAFDGPALRRAAAAMQAGGKTDVKRSDPMVAWLAAGEAGRPALWDAYVGGFLTDKGAPYADPVTKGVEKAAPGAGAAVAAEAARVVAVGERALSVGVAAHSADLLTLAAAFVGTYAALKERRGKLDFDDLILRARALLERPGVAPWVLFKLDGGIDHLLIDEAQDTNPDQWAIVRLLAEEFFAGTGRAETVRTIFVVGDEKQSIFSFQRADPAEFLKMRRHFGDRCAAAGTPLRIVDLSVSFRSVGAVLACVDAVFAQAHARDGVLSDPAEVITHTPWRRHHGGRVEIWPPVAPEDEPPPAPWTPPVEPVATARPENRLARVIAARIAGWIADGETLEARGRPIRAGDLMVLVRRRSGFVIELVRALKSQGVPVAGVDRMVLTDQLAVRDLLALAQVLILPEDDLSLACVLKGPLVGLDEDALMDLAMGREGTLWRALEGKAGTGEPWRSARAWLERLLSRADFAPPYELLAEVLSAPCPADPGGSGRRAILRRLGPEAEDPIDELLTAAVQFEHDHPPALQGFLAWLAASEEEIKREQDRAGGSVRIMTVHGSKGLQAPIVILPDTMGVPTDKTRILWPQEGSAVAVPLWAPRRNLEDATCRRLRAAATLRRDQELRRLLYVALTRAEDRLVVAGWQTKQAPNAGCWYRLIEGAMAGFGTATPFDFLMLAPDHGWAGDGWAHVEAQAAEPRDKEERARWADGPAEALPAWAIASPPSDPPLARPLAPSRPDVEEPPVRSPTGGDDGRRFRRGLILHRLLQSLPEVAPAERRAAAEGYLASPAHGLDAAERAAWTDEVMRVLEDPAFAHVFAPGGLSEVPVVGVVGGRALSGQIDRVLVGDAAVWIVDYKTNRPPPTRVEDVPAAYLGQLAAYRAALAAIWPDRPVRCALLWTDAPRLMEIPGDLLDRTAPG